MSDEHTAYMNELAHAEAWTNREYGEPTAKESYDGCGNAAVCHRAAYKMADKLDGYNIDYFNSMYRDDLPDILGCDDCEHWGEAI
jgi:hypothetical protein